MSPDALFWVTIGLKMAVTAGFVVIASLVAERAAVLGALIATLPIAAGPAYVFLALDHDPGFIAASARTSLAVNAVTAVFALTYAALAQRQNVAVSVSLSLALWIVLAWLARGVAWTLPAAVLLNAAVFALCLPLARRFLHAKMPVMARRPYDVFLRAAMVACLVATVVATSAHVGPAITGLLAVFPIVLLSLMLILQPRIGGPAAAAVQANGLFGLVGFSLCLVTLILTVERLGPPVALSLALAVSVGCNLTLWLLRRRAALAKAVSRSSLPP
jgi:hypothetical protein